MEERTVTVDGTTYELGMPFMVIATQNPVELEGTYPLPEAQRDRFLMRCRSATRRWTRSWRSWTCTAAATAWPSWTR